MLRAPDLRFALPLAVVALSVGVSACGGSGCQRSDRQVPIAGAQDRVVISVVGTNDLHGRLRALPILAGYVENLRAVREADGGGVILVDAGDMFQGTIESNANEGAAVVDAYQAMGYAAAAVGNHEFDYGPVGEAAIAGLPGDDPRGALLARARQADFALLAANIAEASSGERVTWPGVEPTRVVDVAGAKVGLIGVTTKDTLETTHRLNVTDLVMLPLADTITELATKLRAGGAQVVIVAAHAGGSCQEVTDPRDLSTCNEDDEIFEVARALPAGLVDVIVAGHTHAAVAHEVNGIAIIESLAYGRAFGRVDVILEGGKVVRTDIRRMKQLCAFWDRRLPELQRWDTCEPTTYEGADVIPVRAIGELIDPALEAAREQHAEPLGVTLAAPFTRSRSEESALGNLFVDLMLRASPGADVAVTNGGGLRADLPAGKLRFGDLYEAFPFDNAMARVTLTGAQLRALLGDNLQDPGGLLSVAGVRVNGMCDDQGLVVEILQDGRPVRDTDKLTVVTSDFLVTGGDRAFSKLSLADADVTIEASRKINLVLAHQLRRAGGTLSPDDYLSGERPRWNYPGARPVTCQ